jgi:hypothetical protein
MSAPADSRALAPSETERDGEELDLEARRHRVKVKAEALRDRLQHEAEKIDDARESARDFVVRYRWPLLGATTAFGYAVARRRKRRPKQQVVVVDQGAKRNTVWGLLAGRALELATKIALNEVQNRLEDGGLIRTDAEVDSSDE